jgi:hypothetical protein
VRCLVPKKSVFKTSGPGSHVAAPRVLPLSFFDPCEVRELALRAHIVCWLMQGGVKHRAPARNSQQPTYGYRSRTEVKRKGSSWCGSCWCAAIGVTLLLAILVGAIAAHRYRYPSKQRCPPEGDRFFDHCQEGRTHYRLKLDWDCLGPRKSEIMRAALSLDTEGKPLIGVGDLPSWLTDKNAEALRGAPCIRAVEEDKACWYCKPTPKASGESNAALKAAAEKVLKAAAEKGAVKADAVAETGSAAADASTEATGSDSAP